MAATTSSPPEARPLLIGQGGKEGEPIRGLPKAVCVGHPAPKGVTLREVQMALPEPCFLLGRKTTGPKKPWAERGKPEA